MREDAKDSGAFNSAAIDRLAAESAAARALHGSTAGDSYSVQHTSGAIGSSRPLFGRDILDKHIADLRRRLQALEHLRRSLPETFWDSALAAELFVSLR